MDNDLPFYVIAILAIAGATGVLLLKNIMHAAFSLMFCLMALAVLYIYAGAEFLGATQLLVYVGGIVVLLIFGIMLSQVKTEEQQFSRKFSAVILSAGMSILLISLIYQIKWPARNTGESPATPVHDIGTSFFTEHLLAFEIAGILLLVALLGAIAISHRKA